MPRIMAHRGARNLWAENSMPGFQNTLEAGFDAVEFDVHLTAAGEMVVIHDATLERTTDGQGLVRDLHPQERRSLRLRSPDRSLIPACPPLLEEVLALMARSPVAEPWVELKSDAEGRPYPGIVARAVEAVRAAGLEDRAVLHSFDPDVVREIRAEAPEMRRLISVDARSVTRFGSLAALLEEIGDEVDYIGVHHGLFEAELDLLRERRGLKRCSVWTVNEPELMRRWLSRGVGFITTDDPVLLRSLMQAEVAA